MKLQGYMAANYMIGYRLAMIVSGGGALGIANWVRAKRGWLSARCLDHGLSQYGVVEC